MGPGIFKSGGRRVLKSNRIRSKSKNPKFCIAFQILAPVGLKWQSGFCSEDNMKKKPLFCFSGIVWQIPLRF